MSKKNWLALLSTSTSTSNKIQKNKSEKKTHQAGAWVDTMLATWTGEPLVPPFELTTAVKAPALVGGVVIVTVREVAFAAVTVPAAPRLRATMLAEGVAASKPVLVTRILAAFLLVVVDVGETVGWATTVATWVWPLETPKDETTAVKFPVLIGSVV